MAGHIATGFMDILRQINPDIYPDLALQRRNLVISQLKKYDVITPSEADSNNRGMAIFICRSPFHMSYYCG